MRVNMTAGENPFASNTSSLQNQLRGSFFSSYPSILLSSCFILRGVLLSFLFAEKDKELLAAKAEIEALRTNEELKNREFGEVCKLA